MKTIILLLLVALSASCKDRCFKWNKPIAIEDNRACQAARAGGDDYSMSRARYSDCLESLGYYTYELECNK